MIWKKRSYGQDTMTRRYVHYELIDAGLLHFTELTWPWNFFFVLRYISALFLGSDRSSTLTTFFFLAISFSLVRLKHFVLNKIETANPLLHCCLLQIKDVNSQTAF